MKKGLAVGGVLVLAVLAAVFWWRERTREHAAAPESDASQAAPPDRAADDYASYSPIPHISLQIDGQDAPVMVQGTPLLLSLRVANPRAMNAELINRWRSFRLEALSRRAAAGQITKAQVAAEQPTLTRRLPIKTVELGTAGWSSVVRFEIRPPEASPEPLPWPLKPVGDRDEQHPLVLDGLKTDELDYGVDPQAAGAIAPGLYQVVGVLEQRTDAANPGRWHGTVETEPVSLTVVAPPASPTAAQKVERELYFVRYFVSTNQAEAARKHAEAAVAAKPDDIAAHIALGDALAMQKEKGREALAQYDEAIDEFYDQPERPYEEPELLLRKRAMLAEMLGLEPEGPGKR